jgi:hypothetical protein
MTPWLISLFFAAGVSAFVYAKLTQANGNPDPKQNYIATGIVGLLVYIVFFTLIKFVLNF